MIYLARTNLLRRYLSLQSLSKRKIVSTNEESLKLGKLYVNPETIIQELDVLYEESEYEAKLMNSLKTNPILSLSYEESFSTSSSIQSMTDKVFDFLGVTPIENRSNQRKILPKSLDAIVENYEELVEALQASRYAQYLID